MFFTVLGYMFATLIAIPVILFTKDMVLNRYKNWKAGNCYRCDGRGGWNNLLLFFSPYSWERCPSCNGTGKR